MQDGIITKEKALEALESVDNYTKMYYPIEPLGAYNILLGYIRQSIASGVSRERIK